MARRSILRSLLLLTVMPAACALPSIDTNYTPANASGGGGGGIAGEMGEGGATSSRSSMKAGGAKNAGGTTATIASSGGITSFGGSQTVGTSTTGGSASKGGSTSSGGMSTTGGSASKGGSTSSGGMSTTGGSASKGGSTSAGGTTAGKLVAVLADPWGASTTGTKTVVDTIGAIDRPSYLLVAIVSNATDGATTVSATQVSYGGLTFARLAGGNVAGTAFSAEFWGARSPTVQLSRDLTVTMSASGNSGVMVWALDNVNATEPVGAVISQAQYTGDLYQEYFANKRYGSCLFAAFFNTGYDQDPGGTGFLPITSNAGTVVGQTYAGYYAWSGSPGTSGEQRIGATLPGTWTIEHVGIEIVP